MKTLDEVITAFGCFDPNKEKLDCRDCPYTELHVIGNGIGPVCIEEMAKDAVHYLKEYRSDKAQYEADRKQWEDDLSQTLREFDDARDKLIAKFKELDVGTLNPALSWDEMQKMVGEPVWVIDPNGKGKWYLVKMVLHDEAVFTDAWGSSGIGYPKDFGTKWNAYRKERE